MLRTSGWKSIFICWVAIAGKYLIFFLLELLLYLLLYLVIFRPASRPSLEAGSIFFFFWNISFSCSFLFSYLCRTRTATARGRFRRAPSTRISALEPVSGARVFPLLLHLIIFINSFLFIMNVAKNLQLLTSAYDQSHLDKEELAGSITSENFSASSTGSSPASSSSLSVPGWQVVWKEQTFIAEDCNSLKLKILKFTKLKYHR